MDPKYMQCIEEMTINSFAFGEITAAIQAAIVFAGEIGYHEEWVSQKGGLVKFEFNGVMVSVRMDSDPELIYRDYMRAQRGYVDKNVGPFPSRVLTDEEKENDARVEAENEQRRQQRQSKYQAQADAKRNATEAKLADAPEMEIADEAAWQSWKDNNQYGYGWGVIAYAERWARLMQVEINAGKKLEDIADTTSREADIDGITGFMHGAAVSVLATSWVHGEQLRRWHNLDTQIGNE